MEKFLTLAFSAAVLLTGCAQQAPYIIIDTKPPKIIYPKYDTTKRVNISAKVVGSNITMPKEQFMNIVSEATKRRRQIELLQDIINRYNKEVDNNISNN